MSYHNTIPTAGRTLEDLERNAAKQDEKVLLFFALRPGEHTPEEVNAAAMPNAPVTSTRRAISNLAKAGLLVKTGNRRPGLYGVTVNTWKVNERNKEQLNLF